MKKLIIVLLLLPVFALPAFGGFAQEKVDLNTATLEQLDTLSGIGPAYAQRIIDNRPFDSVDDLTRVKGIGEKTLEKIKDQGFAYVEEKSIETLDVGAGLPRPDEEKGEETSPLQVYSGEIKFNEILPSPEGSDSENEWIELYNSSESEIDLSGWIIKDTTGSIKEYILDSKISSLGYLLLGRPETRITLNNDSDGLVLLNPNKEVVDSINFGKAVQGQSYIKTSNEWTWTTTPTPAQENILKKSSVPQTRQPSSNTQKNYETRIINQESTEDGPLRIKLVKELERSSKISMVFVGFLIALCSSIIFLIIKNNLKNFWY